MDATTASADLRGGGPSGAGTEPCGARCTSSRLAPPDRPAGAVARALSLCPIEIYPHRRPQHKPARCMRAPLNDPEILNSHHDLPAVTAQRAFRLTPPRNTANVRAAASRPQIGWNFPPHVRPPCQPHAPRARRAGPGAAWRPVRAEGDPGAVAAAPRARADLAGADHRVAVPARRECRRPRQRRADPARAELHQARPVPGDPRRRHRTRIRAATLRRLQDRMPPFLDG